MNIRTLREQRGWSQEQLAEMSGLSVRTIQRIERGEAGSAETLKSLAAVFEIPWSELQKSDEEAEPKQRPVLTSLERSVLREVRAVRGFHHHFMAYVIICSFLLVLNLMGNSEKLWVVWPAFGWGIGIFFHAMSVYKPFRMHGAQWERREFEKRMAKRKS